MVKDGVGIALVAGREDENVKMFAEVFKNLLGVWPHLHIPAHNLSLHRLEGHLQLISPYHRFIGVDECFVHIEDNGLAVYLT